MENKIIVIICAWAFLIMLWILSFLGEWDLFWPLALSFVVLGLSAIVGLSEEKSQSDEKLKTELLEMKSKMEKTARDVEEIKRIIEE